MGLVGMDGGRILCAYKNDGYLTLFAIFRGVLWDGLMKERFKRMI